MAKIAIVGEGVIGCSSALQLLKKIPESKITVFHDRPFEKTCSFGPAGLFRIDFDKYRGYGKKSFEWFAELHRTRKGSETGVKLISGHIQSDNKERLESQLGDEFDVVVNCAGVDGGNVAGDDDKCYPNRGVTIEVDEPWHKHFNYLDFSSFTIPKNDSIVIGSVRQDNNTNLEVTDEDRESILSRYFKVQPAMKNPKIIKEWAGLRPNREEIRIEAQTRKTNNGKEFLVVHHYGHGSNGFTLGYGTADEASDLVVKGLQK